MNDKKIDKRSISGQRGVNLIERVVLGMGFAWHPTNQSLDAGIDGIIEIRDPQTQRATNCVLQVQSKVVSGRFTAETDTSLEYLCDERDIRYWLGGNVPVLLVVSRPDTGEAYWVSVRHAFTTPDARQARRVTFQKASQRFDVTCREQITSLAAPKSLGLYFPPEVTTERLYSNLLKVKRFAETLYVGATEFRWADDIWARARKHEWDISGEWILTGKQIVSVHNLRNEPWSQLCDVGTVERFGVEEWSASHDTDRRRDFVRLANHCLRAKLHSRGVRYVAKDDVFYFLPSLNAKDLQRKYTYPSVVRQATRMVVHRYERKDGSTKYVRHNAFRGHFEEYDGHWFLEITPTYFYTADGRKPYRFAESYIKGIKRLERNHAVVGQVIMWAAFLTEPPDLFGREYPFLAFDALATTEIEAGIEDKQWLQLEDPAEQQSAKQALDEEGLFP